MDSTADLKEKLMIQAEDDANNFSLDHVTMIDALVKKHRQSHLDALGKEAKKLVEELAALKEPSKEDFEGKVQLVAEKNLDEFMEAVFEEFIDDAHDICNKMMDENEDADFDNVIAIIEEFETEKEFSESEKEQFVEYYADKHQKYLEDVITEQVRIGEDVFDKDVRAYMKEASAIIEESLKKMIGKKLKLN